MCFVYLDMLKLTDEQLDWLTERIPDHELSPKGGRPPADKRKVMQGIFWILDNGAKWKDLPRKFGSQEHRSSLVPNLDARRRVRADHVRRRAPG